MASESIPDERVRLHEMQTAMLATVRDISKYLAGPPAPDAEIQSWPLVTDGEEGGIWCGDPDCPLEAENSEIGEFRIDWMNGVSPVFTLAELHEAIGHHIAARREREADRGE